MVRNKRCVIAAVAVATLALAACGSSSGSKSSGPSDSSKYGGSITIAQNPWDGSKANAAVAKIVLEKQGVTVALKDIDENASWPGLDSGSIDANLEVWPSGHASDITTYIKEKKSVIDGGLIG